MIFATIVTSIALLLAGNLLQWLDRSVKCDEIQRLKSHAAGESQRLEERDKDQIRALDRIVAIRKIVNNAIIELAKVREM